MPRRILIADDEASIRRAVRAFIESRSQFEVCEAADGMEALHAQREWCGSRSPTSGPAAQHRCCPLHNV